MAEQRPKNISNKPSPTGPLAALKESGIVNEHPKNKITPAAEILHNKNPLKTLRTYQGDIAETIIEKDASITQIAIAEQQKKNSSKKNYRKESVFKSTFFYITSLILVILAISTLIFLFLINRSEPKEIVRNESIISYDYKVNIEIPSKRVDLIKKIEEEKNNFKKNGPIIYVELNKNTGLDTYSPINSSDFLSQISNKVPSALLRALDKKFMYGFVNRNTEIPFIILKVKDFPTVFSKMLDWEDSLYKDLEGVVSSYKEERNLSDERTSSTTIKITPIILKKNFEDIVVLNKDLRILRTANGETIILYSFLDQKTLFMTSDIEVFKEIFGNFLSKRN